MTNTFEERINRHKERGRSRRKAYLEEMTKQAGCNLHTDTKRLIINREEWKTRFAHQGMVFSKRNFYYYSQCCTKKNMSIFWYRKLLLIFKY